MSYDSNLTVKLPEIDGDNHVVSQSNVIQTQTTSNITSVETQKPDLGISQNCNLKVASGLPSSSYRGGH